MLKKKLKKAISIFQWLLTVILVSMVLLLIFTAFNPVKSFQIFRVMSGSMEPKIKVGSVVFVKGVNPEILKEGDVITYTLPEDPNLSITHRLIATEEKEGKTVFKTRGDANNSDDIAETLPSQVKGKVIFSLPLLGYLSVWIRKPLGFGLLVILPAILIIISEILNIKKAIEKEVEKKYAKSEKHQKSKPINLLLIFFLLGISLFQIKPTNAYFSDVVVVGGNTFSMASDWLSPTPTPTPTPASVVINEVEYDSVQTGVDSDYEWFELYNNTSSPITLSGWTITDNDSSDTIPELTLPASGFAVVAAKESGFKTNYSGFSGLIVYISDGQIGNGLANTGDRLVLKNDTGTEIDAVSWGDDGYAFGAGNGVKPLTGDGKSIARKTKGVDTNSPTDWQVLDSPNPGTNPHPPEENKEEVESVFAEEEPALEEPALNQDGLEAAQEGSEVTPEDGVVTEEVEEISDGEAEGDAVEEPVESGEIVPDDDVGDEDQAEEITDEVEEEIVDQSEEMDEPTADQSEEEQEGEDKEQPDEGQDAKPEEEQVLPPADEPEEKPQPGEEPQKEILTEEESKTDE